MAEENKSEKKPRKHLVKHEIEETEDGHFLHHHTYQKSRHDPSEREHRPNVAVSTSPEEAGQHVAEQSAMNEPPQPDADPGAQPEPTPAPDAGGGGGAAPAAGM